MAKKGFTIYVEEDVYNRLQELSKARRWSLNVLVNWMIEQVLARLASPSSSSGK